MAPGIPWSNQILNDMLETLKDNRISSKLTLSPPVDGITTIEADLFCDYQRVKKGKTEIRGIRAVVHYYCGRQNQHGFEHPGSFAKTFPMDRTGIKMAIEFLQESVQNVKRRGLCETCLTSESPMKRLRVGGSGFCSSCVLQKAAFE